jgi:peptide chain release factor 1
MNRIPIRTPYIPVTAPHAAGGRASAVIVEIRAGQGGDDAARFVDELGRAYLRLAESRRWTAEITDREDAGPGSRLLCLRVSGAGAGAMAAEGGTHRITRVPSGVKGGVRHTSAVTVAVLPVPAQASRRLDLGQVVITTFRSSGPGGQHAQKNETAIRAVHTPTGLAAVARGDRSQASNRDAALEVLAARVADREAHGERASRDLARRAQTGSGDFAERVRTYAWREGTVTDHRTGATARLSDVLGGDFGPLLGDAPTGAAK